MQALQGLCGVGVPLTSTIWQLWMAIIAECGILSPKLARHARRQACLSPGTASGLVHFWVMRMCCTAKLAVRCCSLRIREVSAQEGTHIIKCTRTIIT